MGILDLFRKPAGAFRAAGSDFAARSVVSTVAAASVKDNRASIHTLEMAVKAAGELPATFPHNRSEGNGLADRSVSSYPQSDYFWALPQKIPPKQIESILRQAASGSLIYQHQLNRRMEESWPTYKKCILELKMAIASAKYAVHPYALPGKKPTLSAQEKADLVTRALQCGFQPDRFADEDGVNGMIFDLCEALAMGVSIVEMLWNEDATDPEGNNESLVRATGWVNPTYITFTADGRMGVAKVSDQANIGFSNQGKTDVMDNPDKFLVAKLKSKSGSCLTAGLMRSLADIWTIVAYGRDFARLGMQKYGNPFFAIAYDSGITDQNMIRRFEELGRQAVANGYCVHPSNTTVTVEPGHTMGADNAQIAMMKLADEACQLLLLGQTLTTSVGNSGSRALGDVHENVRQERIEAHAKWIAQILTEQFADSICRVNYGKSYLKNPERPTIAPDMTRPLSATEQAAYLKDMSQTKVPVCADEIYKRAGVQQPEEGDKVLIGGELVIMEETMTQTEKKEKDFDTQLSQQLKVNESLGEPGQGGGEFGEGEVSAALARATDADRLELENLVSAAELAPHQNGEMVAVKSMLKKLVTQSRK